MVVINQKVRLILWVITLVIGGLIVFDLLSGPATSLTIATTDPQAVIRLKPDQASQWQVNQKGSVSLNQPQTGFWQVEAQTKQARVVTSIEVLAGQQNQVWLDFAGIGHWQKPTIHSRGGLTNPLVINNTIYGLKPQTDDFQYQTSDPDSQPLNDFLVQPRALKVGWFDTQSYFYRDTQGKVNLIIDGRSVTPTNDWLDFAVVDGQAWLLTADGRVEKFGRVDLSRRLLSLPANNWLSLLADDDYLYLSRLVGEAHQDDDHSRLEIVDVYNKTNQNRVAQINLRNLVAVARSDNYLFLLASDKVFVWDLNGQKFISQLDFIGDVVGLSEGQDQQVYLLTNQGQVWRFEPENLAYSLVSQPVTDGSDKSMTAINQSLVIEDNKLYFGVYYPDSQPLKMVTYWIGL